MAVAATAQTLIQGASLGEALKAGVIAGVSAYVGASIGGLFEPGGTFGGLDGGWDMLAEASMHGVTSGGFSELAGGDFGSGFVSGFVGSLGARGIASQTGLNRTQGAILSALVGGTAADLGGGSFANGAATAAVLYLLATPSDTNVEYPERSIEQITDDKSLYRLQYGGDSGFISTGTFDEMASLATDLDSIWRVPEGRALMNEIFGDEHRTTVVLRSGKTQFQGYANGSGVLYYDPSRFQIEDWQYTSGMRPFMKLANELQHVSDISMGLHRVYPRRVLQQRSNTFQNHIHRFYDVPLRSEDGTLEMEPFVVPGY